MWFLGLHFQTGLLLLNWKFLVPTITVPCLLYHEGQCHPASKGCDYSFAGLESETCGTVD